MPHTFRGRQHGRAASIHHHDKYAASKDGHRGDDPHGVTGPWRGGEGGEEITARPVGWTGAIRRQPQTVPYDDEQDYGQRVEALEDLADRVDWEEQGWEPYDLEGPLAHESDVYSKLATEGQNMRDLKYKDNPDVLSGEHGKAGGEDPLGWQSPQDKAQAKAQRALQGSLDPLASEDDTSRAINSLRTPAQTSKERWRKQRKQSQDEWEAGAHERKYPHLYPHPLDG